MAPCPGENTLMRFLAGGLPAEEAQGLHEHIDGCESCRQALVLVAPSGVTPPLTKDGAEPVPVGTRVARYVVMHPVGAGGMGVVLAAYDPELDRKVALKLLRADAAPSEETRARLLREAQALARLSHPNVVSVFDAGTFQGQVFMAMEYVRGGTLRQWLAAGPRSWREVLQAFLQAGRGLEAAHAAGLVHRDFKPDNVLVGEDARVRVTDFGLAGGRESPGPERPVAEVVPPPCSGPSRGFPMPGTPCAPWKQGSMRSPAGGSR